MKPPQSYEEMQELMMLRDGETESDVLSLYDAQNRYGISRNALREAALIGKVRSAWLGGLVKRSLYLQRKDILKYLSLSQKKSKSKKIVPWRKQDIIATAPQVEVSVQTP